MLRKSCEKISVNRTYTRVDEKNVFLLKLVMLGLIVTLMANSSLILHRLALRVRWQWQASEKACELGARVEVSPKSQEWANSVFMTVPVYIKLTRL